MVDFMVGADLNMEFGGMVKWLPYHNTDSIDKLIIGWNIRYPFFGDLTYRLKLTQIQIEEK